VEDLEPKKEDKIAMAILDVQVQPHGKRKIDRDGNDYADSAYSIDNDSCRDYEFVLVVPQKLTKIAQNVIYARQVTPLRYHLEGRFGSRTHRIDESHMGLPLTSLLSLDESKAQLEKAASQYSDVRALINSEGVKFYYKPYYEPAPHKARSPPYVDARIHPDREPEGRGDNAFWNEFTRTLKSKAGTAPAEEFNHTIPTAAATHQINHFSLRKESDLFTYAELFAGTTIPELSLMHEYCNDTNQNYLPLFFICTFRRNRWLRNCIGCPWWKMYIYE
jgi:hypothetical protein